MKNKVKAFLITIMIMSVLIGLYMYAEKYLNFYLNFKSLLICVLAENLYRFIKQEFYETKREKRKNMLAYGKKLKINKIKIICSKHVTFKDFVMYSVDFTLYNNDTKVIKFRETYYDESKMLSSLEDRGICTGVYKANAISENKLSYIRTNVDIEYIEICDSCDKRSYFEVNLYDDEMRNCLILDCYIDDMEMVTNILNQLE